MEAWTTRFVCGTRVREKTWGRFQGHTDDIISVVFLSGGSKLASGSRDETIRLWDVHAGKSLRILGADPGGLNAIAFSYHEAMLASGSRDAVIRLRDVHTAEITKTFNWNWLSVTSVAFSPDGSILASASADGTVLLWDVRQITTWGGIKRPAFVDGAKQTVQLSPSATPATSVETALLPNYPNPFNPETWIPYQLAKRADVVLAIYDMKGQVVRTLAVGHQPTGTYRSRDRAVYWDGRNQQGETVANGLYFCTLSAGDFSATRKMLVGK